MASKSLTKQTNVDGVERAAHEDVFDAMTRLASESQSTAKTKRSRQRESKGLPALETLRELAEIYLKLQRELWPELARRRRLPGTTPQVIELLATAFERRFRDGLPEVLTDHQADRVSAELGAGYLRFSDDNSNPRSLVQQLRNILTRAARDGAFIPWAYVFADAAVTGTVAARRGYQTCKDLLRRKNSGLTRLYIDEVGRASRDALEALGLGRLVNLLGLRMIGASDNFDSGEPDAKIKLHMYAMLQEWFVDQLRCKVYRGMEDAFLRGANIFAACLGYRLVPKIDVAGNVVLDRDGMVVVEKVIDPEGAAWVLKAYELFATRGWTRMKIAGHFNEQSVGGTRTWDATRVTQLLEREVYQGVEFYRKTRQRRDAVTGGVTVLTVPAAKRLSRDVPHLKIVEPDLWEQAQARIARSREVRARRKGGPRRSETQPTTLLRPICGCCKEPLILGRSGNYASFCCINGRDRKQGCTFHSYKSVNVIETVILTYLRNELFTEAFVVRVVQESNAQLVEVAARPPVDAAPLEAAIGKKEAAIRRVSGRLEEIEDAADLDDVFTELARLRKEVEIQKERLRELRSANAVPPPPVTRQEVAALIGEDLRGLLAEEVTAAAPVLAALVGPIEVTESPDKRSKHGTAWIGKFTVNAVPVLLELAARRRCPTASVWECL